MDVDTLCRIFDSSTRKVIEIGIRPYSNWLGEARFGIGYLECQGTRIALTEFQPAFARRDKECLAGGKVEFKAFFQMLKDKTGSDGLR